MKNEKFDKHKASVNEIIKYYKNSVLQEMYYIREQGGRRYQLYNGTFIRAYSDKYIYVFDLDSELHLAEDSPVTLYLPKRTVSGYCQNCEEYQIFLMLEEFVGNKISSARISVEPWRLLQKLCDRLDEITSKDKIVYSLIKNKVGLKDKDSISCVIRGQNEAISNALVNPITVIWGPPGTGKTYTMAQIAMKFLLQGKSILMVSHSNVSVDGMMLEVYDQIQKSNNLELKDILYSGKLLRYGNVRDEDLINNEYVVSHNFVLNKYPKLLQRQKEIFDEKKIVDKKSVQFETLNNELKSIRNLVKKFELEYVENAKLLATTISKVSMNSIFEEKKYDVVMFDEASMAYIPHVFEAAAIAEDHFICVGDFRQLPPICQSDAKNVLGKDIFNYLDIVDDKGQLNYHPWMVMLNEQRRMYPAISKFSNISIYEGLLKNYKNVKRDRIEIVKRAPFEDESLVLVDLSSTYCCAGSTVDNSKFNIVSALTSFQIAIDAIENGQQSVGIITPYQAQSRLIQALIYDYKEDIQDKIVCSTIHQFQGSERDVIIFDSVESFPYSRPGIIMKESDDDHLLRLVNVAVTRARGKLIVVTNQQFWTGKFSNPNINMFYDLISYIKENGLVISHKDKSLDNYLNSLKFSYKSKASKRVLRLFRYFDDMCMLKFNEDLSRAEQEIIISIPDGKLDFINQAEVLFELDQINNKGIEVVGKSSDYEVLSPEWRKYIWKTDEKTFPLVFIDDKILWYGLPMSEGLLKDKKKSYVSSYKNYFRITAKKTVEVLQNMTNIRSRVVDNMTKTITTKSYDNVREVYKEDVTQEKLKGLDLYVHENVMCPKCGAPMKLAKVNKVFLKCSSCSNTSVLDKNIVEEYVSECRPLCPIHKTPLNVRFSYNTHSFIVKCEAFDHKLNIEDI